MYSDLLDAALSEAGRPDEGMVARGALAELLHYRRMLEEDAARTGPDWALQALADQLGYDVALIRLARRAGVRCSVRGFDQPEQERGRLEHDVERQGIKLHGSEELASG
jgi:hypothetical protein